MSDNTPYATSDKNTWLKRARNVFDTELDALARTRDALGEAFVDSVEYMRDSLEKKGKIVITGVGKNLPIAEKISATMASVGVNSITLNPVQAMHGDLGMLCGEDCLVALSFSGESEEIIRLLPAVQRRKIPILGIAGKLDCTMARYATIMLPVATPKEADPFNMAPTASTTATLALGDALAMVLLDAAGFTRADYARNHPAGAIGKTLLTRVTDIMRTGRRVAKISLNSTIQDALVAMTRAQAGAACVVDDEEKLLGIFTDGDLRRSLADGGPILSHAIRDYMTPSPKHAVTSQMASDILNIFQRYQIDDIPVIDDAGRLAGCVDIADLPKLKVL